MRSRNSEEGARTTLLNKRGSRERERKRRGILFECNKRGASVDYCCSIMSYLRRNSRVSKSLAG